EQRLAGVAALLRAVVYKAVLADVEVTGSGAALPAILAPVGDVVLEEIDARVAALFHRTHGRVDLALLVLKRLQLTVAVVDDADGGSEAQFEGAAADFERVLGIADATPDHGIDVDVEQSVLRKQLQLLVEHLEALLRDFVGHDVVDRDLQ